MVAQKKKRPKTANNELGDLGNLLETPNMRHGNPKKKSAQTIMEKKRSNGQT